MDFEGIITNIKNKIFHPVYLLSGEEPYFIDMISDFIEENVLDDTEKEFNQSILYGRDVEVPTIIENVKRFPMMANHQVVIIKEAQDIKKIAGLESYVANPLESTILVLCYKYKKIDKRTSFYKAINKKGVFFESKKLYENKIPVWIETRLKEKGFRISPKASMLLTEHIGADLSKLRNEIEKLLINLKRETMIDEDIIEENIGISKEYNIFELQKALGERDMLKANKIVLHFAANTKEHPMVLSIGGLSNFFARVLKYHFIQDKSKNNVASVLGVHPYFTTDYQRGAQKYSFSQLKTVISHIQEYDLKSKGLGSTGNTTGGELLKELVFKILN